ncbi:MAG: UDP-N-acetylmuramate--L-alanine ligase [Parcubacteria group bacterium]|nr:UDP-N-acetylmuramate--L-alanine ligase [Parcubacteria group bacterium]
MTKNLDLNSKKKIYFIGIGGIGMSALARMMLSKGKEVFGSDRSESLITKQLEEKGARIFIGQKEENITSDIDVVVYTIAVEDSNPELKKARAFNIPTISYPEALGIISEGMFTIAVSGTHGKTTTTAMIGRVLSDAKKSPTMIVGSLLQEQKTNFVKGTSDLFIVEACEYKRSFLHLNPNILVITNIDDDHLDYYKDIADIQSAFSELARKVPADGFVVTNPHDSRVAPALKNVHAKIIDYTSQNKNGLKLRVPGEHNILNAQVALAVADILKIPREDVFATLADFKGTWRRFEYKGKTKNGALVYDDYAHHPTEIKATLKAARELFPDKKIIVIFQPHLYSRTKLLMGKFAKSFGDADEVIVAPIYAAREKEIMGVNSEALAEKIKEQGVRSVSLKDTESIVNYIKTNAKPGDIIFTIGAGDIYKIGERLAKTN